MPCGLASIRPTHNLTYEQITNISFIFSMLFCYSRCCKTKSRTQNSQPTPDCLQSVTAQCCVQSRAVEWLMFLIALMHAIDNYFNRAYSAVESTLTLLSYRIVSCINASVWQAYYVVRCHQQTTTRLIYKMWPLSNLPSINFNSLSAENYYSSAATAT